MKLTSVRALIYKDRAFDNWETEVAGRWSIEDLRADEGYCNDWISFDCLAWNDQTQTLYIGLTAINTDVLHAYDARSNIFTSLGFQRISDKFDAKIHRSMERDHAGQLYIATALLHDMDQQHVAQGGKLVRYDPRSGEYALLAIPVAHQYIQSIILDRARQLIYGFTYPAEYLFCYDLETQATRILAYLGNSVMLCQPHCAALDSNGRLWGTWGENRAYEDLPGPVPIRIFSYNPDTQHFTWFQHGFPKVDRADPARVDHMVTATDGRIYVGTTTGGFSRLDPTTGDVEDLGKPFPGPRLAGLVEGPDGLIYGAGNAGYGSNGEGTTKLFVFDPATSQLQDLGRICDPDRRAGAVKVHMLVATGDGTLYAGENDNVLRSSYLWECKVAP